jgi:hypothetical protein
MDLNNIQITPEIATALYRFSLVDGPLGTATAWKYLGENKKNILIVVNHIDTTHLPDEDLAFLTTILSACKLSLADVAIVNKNNYSNQTYKEYTGHFKSKIVLLFGTDPVSFGLPLDFPHFQVQSFSKCTFLYSPSLNEYDQLVKSKLWVCLQRIFGV